MPEKQSDLPKIQFVITEDQLEDIYTSINYAPGPATIRTQLMLSKPEKEFVTPDDVYDDCYILSLTKGQIDTIVLSITTTSQFGSGQAASAVRNSVERGNLERA